MSQSKYDQRTEANIATLQTDFADRVGQWLAEARQQGGSRGIRKLWPQWKR